ncbi:MAG: pyrroline-5-carboxylate reductase [Myxococcota bacterium]
MEVELSERRIGFLGAGAMAGALATGLVEAGVPTGHIAASDPDPERRRALEAHPGIETLAENAELVARSDVVVLAVKPPLVAPVLEALTAIRDLDCARPLWVSIAAGIPVSRLAATLPPGARIVRAMPNTPALVGSGATAFVAGPGTEGVDRATARALFESVGLAWEAPQEALLDAVTGLSGSGPAFVLVFLEALGDAGERVGLPREAAERLALQTLLGTARLVQETGRDPASLRNQVTSPGGTTIEGLGRLEAGGLRATVHDAVQAATRRSRELGG